ncbi:MAG TPA: hypothetical protein VM223_19510, partial [Planctomycetota bacterium]|nr:hypothetical protein [Planctomycetota bacterium]
MKKNYPPRPSRSDSFLGIHFDFHAGDDCTQIGRNVTRRMVEQIIDAVHPDYLQCDCKGHRGLCSYPTKVGNPAPGFVRDQLRIWRDVTAERGVSLYMHYSGVWDAEACKRHPSWACVDENGKRSQKITSVFGPYADKLLIPQLRELADVYGVDGVWADGECWATVPDWHPNAIKAWIAKTGIKKVPRKPHDPHYAGYLEFCREAFRRYLAHWVDELHRTNPTFQIASNWAYSSFMPEPVTTNVDFISGDYSLQNSVNTARLEARAMPRQGKPWDLMAWSFAAKWGEGGYTTKCVPQLQQEAAIVLAAGGGFQAYFQQKRDGSVAGWQMKLMAETAMFCRARQAVCHRAKAVPQIGLVLSAKAFYRKSSRLFAPWGGELVPLSGVMRSLLESQYSVEVLEEHHLAGRMAEYPLLVVPEWDWLPGTFKRALLEYVRGGGNLLAIGPACAAMFRKELRVKLLGNPEEKLQYVEHDGWLGALKTVSQQVKLGPGARAFGRLRAKNDIAEPSVPAASIAKLGKGCIAATYVNLGERYVNGATATARDFLAALVRELFPKPIVEVTGSHSVDVAVNRIGGKLAVNLVNTAGPHANEKIYAFDEIPAVGPLTVIIRTRRKPKKVTLQPAGRKINYAFSKGTIELQLKQLAIHEIIVVE